MRRFALAVALVLVSSIVSAQTPKWSVHLGSLAHLGISHVFAVMPVELNGKPGSEYLLRTNPLINTLHIIVPTANGPCSAGTVTLPGAWLLVDDDGDGRVGYQIFNESTQVVSTFDFDISACE